MMSALPDAVNEGDCFDAERLRRELSLEVKRLDALLEKYFALAMAGDGLNINAGLLYCKLAARKATLLGLDAPASHAMSIIVHRTEERRLTSTQEIGALIDDIRRRAITAPSEPENTSGHPKPN